MYPFNILLKIMSFSPLNPLGYYVVCIEISVKMHSKNNSRLVASNLHAFDCSFETGMNEVFNIVECTKDAQLVSPFSVLMFNGNFYLIDSTSVFIFKCIPTFGLR